jgi:hypothetical protein
MLFTNAEFLTSKSFILSFIILFVINFFINIRKNILNTDSTLIFLLNKFLSTIVIVLIAYMIWFFSIFRPKHTFNFQDWMITTMTVVAWGIVYALPGSVVSLITCVVIHRIIKGIKS